MDVMGEGKAPARSHILKAAQAAGLSVIDAASIIDGLLGCATDKTLKTLAQDLPIRSRTLATVRKAIDANRRRLAAN